MLHAFTGGKDGAYPWAGLIFDAKGNLYGTAMQGGSLINCRPGCGVVFKLSPSSNGLWTETVLHTFGGSQDGAYPGANMIFDTQGNLYGTTWQGGVPSCNSGHGCGVVFKLSPTASGPWTETVLHVFTAGSDGWQPDASLVPDAAGNLYGTTQYGGGNFSVCAPYGCGTVFEIMP